MSWAYKHDAALRLPYQDNLSALIHEPSFRAVAGEAVFSKARVINTLGNRAVHSTAPCRRRTRSSRCGELFHVVLLVRPHLRARRAAGAGPCASTRLRCPKTVTITRADRRPAAHARRPRCARRTRSSPTLLAGQDGARRRADATARGGRRGEEGCRRAAGHPRLLRGRDPRLLHRPAAQGGRLAARPRRATASSRSPACRTTRAAASSTTCSGATTASRSAWSRPSARAATRGSASSRRSSMPTAWSTQFGQRPVIFYSNGYEHWLWDDARYPPRRVSGLLQEGRAGAADPAPHDAQAAGDGADQPDDRRALLPDPRHPPHRRGVRARPRPQGAAGDGHGRRQDAHGDRALRPADALQLGQARALPRRPRGARATRRSNAFKAHLPDASPVNLRHREGRPRAASSSRPTRR